LLISKNYANFVARKTGMMSSKHLLKQMRLG
jgi:hypothetical protein